MKLDKHKITITITTERDKTPSLDEIIKHIKENKYNTSTKKACCENMDLRYVNLQFEPGDRWAWCCKNCNTWENRIK